ncbi:MAG TPA: transglycosylase domain-containing protein, partial [Candidatus Saccharimonadales bacterium]|nr:transglycosylase domain-containing protein [Candidatus Saccharimonadales bacterium]
LALGLFLQRDITITRKIREALLATEIERTYTKEEILTFYCNQVYLGHGYYGVEAASHYYFGKNAKDLTLPEASLLAGLIQRPESLTPHRNPARALTRRNHVLDRMLAEGYIDETQWRDARKAPVQVVEPKPPVLVADYFTEEIRREIDTRYGADALYRSGLSIETGLDLGLQQASEEALQRGVREIAKRAGFERPEVNVLDKEGVTLDGYADPSWDHPAALGQFVTGLVMQASASSATIRVGAQSFEIGPDDIAWTKVTAVNRALKKGDLAPFEVVARADGSLGLVLSANPEADGAVVALDPASGEIRALVGGLDFSHSQFDRATQARRQPGSSFKPIIYSAALEEGWRTTDLLMDEPTVFKDPHSGVPYQPENYYRDYQGLVTVRRALEDSLNIPTVRLLNMVGYRRAVEQARKLGITSPLNPYPALGLGASEVTLLEMVSAYSTFPNLGTRVEPRLYSKITSPTEGLREEVPPRANDALRPEVAYLMTSLLKGVIARGTGVKAAGMGEELAGKTGTTDDNTDAWFIGYSPSIVIGVWVGRDEKASIGRFETGARAALPIWMEIMGTWLKEHPDETFRRPPGIETVAVDPDTGLRAGIDTGCDHVILEDYRADNAPPPLCGEHAHRIARLPYYLQRYPWIENRTMVLTDADLARLIRENGNELLVDSGQKLIVTAGQGVDVIPFLVVREDDPMLAGLPGAEALDGGASFGSSPPGRNDLLSRRDRLPPDLAPLDDGSGDPPVLGIDGRTAAVVEIHYP